MAEGSCFLHIQTYICNICHYYCSDASPTVFWQYFSFLSTLCFLYFFENTGLVNLPHKAYNINGTPLHFFTVSIKGPGEVRASLEELGKRPPPTTGRIKRDEPDPLSSSGQVVITRTYCDVVLLLL